MKKICYLLLLLFTVCSMTLTAQRHDVLINKDWTFRFSHQVSKTDTRRVDLPHTWNAQDALSGKMDYKRGIGNYEKTLLIKEEWKGERLFLRFEGANAVANVFINGKHVGEHRGGYTAFLFEITDHVNYGKENSLLVRVNNAEQLDIMPLVGDFNFYGGIYRDVHFLRTQQLCISPLDHASPGVYLVQQEVSKQKAKVCAKVLLSNGSKTTQQASLKVTVKEGNKVLLTKTEQVELDPQSDGFKEIEFGINRPRLWNGTVDPFMYQVEVDLISEGKQIDKVQQPLGLRFFHTDANKGFFLNGSHLQLNGVCRHQDRAQLGNALLAEHHQEDVEIMVDMGVNALRLSHYPQAEEMYRLLDKTGIVAWSEIPFVGPGGYADKGFVNQEAFKANGKLQLVEMIRQNFNHPSICFWGLFNELKEEGDNPNDYIKELNELAHQEDPTRPTTAASNQPGEMNLITDNIAWNRYDGWYGGMPDALGKWLDETHAKYPEIKISISEYGAGGSLLHQQEELTRTTPNSWWHPENWQTYYHMANWEIIKERPYLWGTFIWNMFDFGAAHRTEGDRPGINDKGLVTFDRKERKDAFYFYKANWNKKKPMLHIANKRVTTSKESSINIMAFTNAKNAELIVNGKRVSVKKTDKYATVKWENVRLNEGKNKIQVRSLDNVSKTDQLVVVYDPHAIDR